MAVHNRAELDKVGRTVKRSTRASLMSDTKWRLIISVLEEHPELKIRQWIVKFIDRDQETTMTSGAGLHPPWPWVDTTGVGPVPLRAIEWLLIPRVAVYTDSDRTIPPRHLAQDADGAWRAITALRRQFPMELTERGVFVRGYL
jgi:hypothetical protein